MTMTDQDIQDVQNRTRPLLESDSKKSKAIVNGEKPLKVHGKYYKVIDHTNNENIGKVPNQSTQAIAVAPCDANGKNVDYKNVTITVGGTQTGNAVSVARAVQARNGLTAQTSEVEAFYKETERIAKQHGGGVAAISGHSQAGPAAAKVGAKHHVGKIVNFQPWGSEAAVNDKSSRGINADEKKYLDKHCHTYTDSGKNTVMFDGSGGKCAYGKIYVAEGSSHGVGFFKIKGNGLNVDYYYKHNLFCSGMTEEQVTKIADHKASGNKSDSREVYIHEYKNKFGHFAKANKPSTQAANLLDNQRAKISALPAKRFKHGKRKSGRSGKSIFLKPDGIPGITSKVKASAKQAETELCQTMDEAKEEIYHIINQTRDEAFAVAPDLSPGEIESLLAEIDFYNCWDAGAESSNLSQIRQFVLKVEKLANNIDETSDIFQSVDEVEAGGMTLL